MLAAVVLFGAVAWMHARGAADLAGAHEARVLTYVLGIMWVLALAALVYVRGRWRASRHDGERGAYAVVAWTLGELPAIAGALYLFRTGDPSRYLAGVLLLLLAFYLVREKGDAG
jgi:hypothetical protein